MARKSGNGNIADTGASATNGNNGSATSGDGANPIFAAGAIFVEPSSLGGGTDNASGDGNGGTVTGEPIRKRRGRKPGSTNKKSNPPLRVEGIELVLLSTHQMLAAIMKAPEMALDQEEAHSIATAATNVARHYDVTATEKTVDWIALFMALGSVYGPRIYVLGSKRKPKPEKQAENIPATTASPVHIPGVMQ